MDAAAGQGRPCPHNAALHVWSCAAASRGSALGQTGRHGYIAPRARAAGNLLHPLLYTRWIVRLLHRLSKQRHERVKNALTRGAAGPQAACSGVLLTALLCSLHSVFTQLPTANQTHNHCTTRIVQARGGRRGIVIRHPAPGRSTLTT